MKSATILRRPPVQKKYTKAHRMLRLHPESTFIVEPVKRHIFGSEQLFSLECVQDIYVIYF